MISIHSKFKPTIIILSTIISIIALLLAGCASSPENSAVTHARSAYMQAQADPNVSAKAPVAMYEAEKLVKNAEQAETKEEKEHLAYLAESQIQIAMAQAEQKIAEEEAEELNKEAAKMQLKIRTREVEAAKKEAAARVLEVEQAKKEAAAKALEAEQAKKNAAARALEVEQAKKEAAARTLEAEQAKKDAAATAIEIEQVKRDAEARIKELEKELTELKTKQTDRGLVLTLGDVLFKTGEADLMPGAMRTIDKLAVFMEKNPKRNLLIEGHTDSVGSDKYNLELSKQRAEAVLTALLKGKLGADRIIAQGYGKKYPVADNSKEAGRQQNRRVEIVILNEGVNGATMLR